MKDFDINKVIANKFNRTRIASKEECEAQVKKALKDFEKANIKEAISLLIDNMEIEEAIKVIKEDEIKNFIYQYENRLRMEFNISYYDKWKLKNKIDNF